MKMPYLQEIPTTRDMIRDFRGYNHNDVIPMNEFYDMQNMTSSRYPIISPREKRGILQDITKPNGIFSKGHLYWVDGTRFYGNDGENGETMLRGNVMDSPKQFVSMGAYLLIWPDKYVYNTATHIFEPLERMWVPQPHDTITYTPARINDAAGATEEYDGTIVPGTTAPEDPVNGTMWLDTSVSPNVLRLWSSSLKTWQAMATTYVKISAPQIGIQFSKGDGVTISNSTLNYFNQTFVVWDSGANYITVIGLIDQVYTQTGASGIFVKRSVPDMDFVTSVDNRMWGCSSEMHELYASKKGDPFNWNVYEGISTDSAVIPIGSDGDFTGAITYAGYVWFFKENCVHKIMGNKPTNFQVTEMILRGVEKGSEKSLVIVNETLYYKSRTGVVMFQGGTPDGISDAFGSAKYKSAAAGSLGDKYYISMQDYSGDWHMFVYDETRNMWHREDNTHATGFATVDGRLYFTSGNKIYTAIGEDEGAVEWFAETGDLGMDSPDNKRISKIVFRMDLEVGSSVSVSVQFDSDGQWKNVYQAETSRKRAFLIPVIPYRCDHFKIRVSGKGGCKIYSISKVTEQGSEL